MKKRPMVTTGSRVGMLALVVGAWVMGTAFAAPAPKPSPTPTVVGDWNGALSTGSGSLRVVIHVMQNKDGTLTATMDSPDQGATGIAISTIGFNQSDFHFEIQRIAASYDGKINKDNSEITGEWKQSGASLPLIFNRTTK